jgi:hypothetical protein
VLAPVGHNESHGVDLPLFPASHVTEAGQEAFRQVRLFVVGTENPPPHFTEVNEVGPGFLWQSGSREIHAQPKFGIQGVTVFDTEPPLIGGKGFFSKESSFS